MGRQHALNEEDGGAADRVVVQGGRVTRVLPGEHLQTSVKGGAYLRPRRGQAAEHLGYLLGGCVPGYLQRLRDVGRRRVQSGL